MSNDFYKGLYNPDVLTCLANLSNDEVFTPPEIANQMINMLPQELFDNPDTKFLDPACKSGIFLREIAKRLDKGLVEIIPDKQQRIDHIFKNQLYGIAITELTSLLTRRGVYCSKYPNSKYSVSKFESSEGNIRYRKIKHSWKNGRCAYCGANQNEYDRDDSLESHAYEFIHSIKPEEIVNMKFDVIIGNPPYQMNDGGGTGSSAMPIYHHFVEQAKKLKPRYLAMIIPSRWFTGGRGLEKFRASMLKDKQVRVLHDFPNAGECFPGVEIKGGVCYFLWCKDHFGKCQVNCHKDEKITSTMDRYLQQEGMEILIRNNEAINIFERVKIVGKRSFLEIVSANDPFGFDVREADSYKRVKPNYVLSKFKNSVRFYYNGWKKEGIGFVDETSITKNLDWVRKYKVLIPKAWGKGDASQDILQPFIILPQSCCSETYLVIGPFNDENTCKNVISYIQTKFFHFMVSLHKITQNTMQKAYSFVPMQDFSKPWTDEELYTKYGLSEEEIACIESMIRPMDVN